MKEKTEEIIPRGEREREAKWKGERGKEMTEEDGEEEGKKEEEGKHEIGEGKECGKRKRIGSN